MDQVAIDELPPGTIPDCRPVNIGGAERRFITRAYFDDSLVQTYTEILGPVQNGVVIKNGISITAFGVQAALDADPSHGVVKGDLMNGFNEAERQIMLSETKQEDTLSNTVVFMQALLDPSGYVAMGNGTRLIDAPFSNCDDGGHQGAVETSFLFGLAVNKAFKNFHQRLQEVGGGLTAIVDDNYAIGPPRELFLANKQFAIELKEVGLTSQPTKAECYIDEAYRNDEWHQLRGDIPEGTLEVNGCTVRGMVVCFATS